MTIFCPNDEFTPLNFTRAQNCQKAVIYLQDLLGVRQGFQEGAIQRKVLSWSQHPKYISGRAYYDAAVAVADQLIEYTEYVRPVCLPMTPVDDDDAFADDLVTLAGKMIN